MNLINQLFFAVLISSATSTLLFFVWWLLRGFFFAADARLIYFMLRCVCIMYLMPIGYIAVLITYRKWLQGYAKAWMMVFSRTNEMTGRLHVLAKIWFAILIVLIAYFLLDHYRLNRRLADNIPEDDPVVVRAYRKVCGRLGILPGTLALSRNVEIPMPCIIGWRHPEVVLPERDYTQEELELVFFHELSHYKHKDLKFKAISVFVMMVHCFNPAAWLLLRKVNFWSECMADASALEASGNLRHIKPYFDNIVDLIPVDRKSQLDSAFISTLCRSKKMMDRRVDFMQKYRIMKSAGKVVTAAVALAFVLASGTTAYASGKTVADLHNVIYQNTENQTNLDQGPSVRAVLADDGMIEYHCRVEDLDMEGMQVVSTPEQDIVAAEEGIHYSFAWTVNPNTRHVSRDYYMYTSQRVLASCTVTPGSKLFWLGIMDDHGNAYYVTGRGSASHNFNIPESCRYCVFIQNNYTDGTELTATGSFVYENK